jgi:hypothetical protein
LPSSPGASDRASAPRPNGSEGPHWEESQSEAIRTASDKTSSGGAERGAIDSHKPAPPPATETPPSIVQPPVAPPISAVSPAKRQIVNSARIFLDYQIENSAVNASGAIEVWLTRDQGRTWQKAAEDAQRKNPIGVTLPGEGVFGLTLMVAGPQGPTTGPAPNAAADWWLEVDTTKPTAQITNLQVTHEKGQAIVNLSWNVKDANLGDAPVELYFAATHQGPWLPIAKGLRADGQHRWTPPTEIGAQTHLQLIARDVAGNECICRTTEPVNLVDPTRPRVVIREVRTEAPTAPVTVTPPISARPVPNPVGPPTQPFQIIQSQPRN